MARDMSATTPSIIESGTVMLNKIRERGYTEYSQFRSDLNTYLDRIDERNSTADTADAATQTWQEAAQWLKEDYWRGFLFDPDLELASFLA